MCCRGERVARGEVQAFIRSSSRDGSATAGHGGGACGTSSVRFSPHFCFRGEIRSRGLGREEEKKVLGG